MKKMLYLFVGVAVVFALAGCTGNEIADKIYIHGVIITVDKENSVAQAVAVKDGKILAVGTDAAIEKLKGDSTVVVDLEGKTLVPGFIDGHSHFGLRTEKSANVEAPPVGVVTNIPTLIAELEKFRDENKIQAGEWIIARGYDPDQLAEHRHPTKDDLDAAFPNNPVAVTHTSGHMLVANSYALKLSGITADTPNPDGGVIVRKPNSGEPNGLLQESAGRLLKRSKPKELSYEEKLELLQEAQLFYASNGLTTAQIGSTGLDFIEFLTKASKDDKLLIDVEALAGYHLVDRVLENPEYTFGKLDKHFKIAGFKLVSDGSPQGKTAFFTESYLTDVPGCNHGQCTGVPTVTQQYFNEAIYKGYKNNIQTYVHCNGDAAIDMYIRAIHYADSALNTSATGRRSVVIHSQFARPDQLDVYKELGVVPAFFSNHAFFWGDQHTRNLGEKRASFLSPLKTAAQKGLIATNHTDFSVTPLNQLFLLWTSVARESRTGRIIGESERLSPIEGLRAITINGAYQYFEEDIKGSIEKGKLADFVILSGNPLSVTTAKIKEIKALETIKEGKTIFKL
ncbi:MAG: amidohydrolase [Prevotella sp.]|nr:amidohydrolase [Prevotella sp.]